MPARIYKLLGGSYHDDKGIVERGSIVIADKDLHKIHRGKFQLLVIEQLKVDQLDEYRQAIERFCRVDVVEKQGKWNVVSKDGVYILREWGAKTKADAAAKKERKALERRKKAFFVRLEEVIPIITRETTYHELEAELDDNDEPIKGGVDLVGSGGTE